MTSKELKLKSLDIEKFLVSNDYKYKMIRLFDGDDNLQRVNFNVFGIISELSVDEYMNVNIDFNKEISNIEICRNKVN